MKRFLLQLIAIWKQKIKIYFIAAWIGAGVGIFLLAPSYDYISSRENNADPLSSVEYVLTQFKEIMTGQINQNNIILFYAEIGAILGLLSLGFYRVLHKRLLDLDALKSELDKDLPSIIRQGEGPLLEFKSSLRWDMQEQRINRALEAVVMKTLAGFLNSHLGGTLLIGVRDDGEIIGLEKDYQTLKRPDQDGFEQTLMTAISANLGADLCANVHILFHVIDHKDVCRVIISPALRPVFLSQGNTPKFFVRTGGGTRDLNIQEALEYVAGRWKNLKMN
ncbi:AlbA family DNA-binding domain-containing protein [Methylomonas rivi]|uniref:ATP-binding protein n=1 Tax=Methylomonas rivi TaxID=2952226 RepID=A0ABT1U1G4_9GAMM|nr:ATP-binding protein [Methylomonas sp. WSC-6]MCQ8127672.1 ATP-binding protein [Methylomonas sp. WSC-6]